MRTLNTFATLLLVLSFTASLAQDTYDLVATDFVFTPDLLNINAGDTVRVTLNAGHGFREVSEASWNLNIASQAIGWEFSPTGQISVHELVPTVPGTIFYVCVPHVYLGMKGRIVVAQGTIGLEEYSRPRFLIHPNPATGVVRIIDPPAGAVRARVMDTIGRFCSEDLLLPGSPVHVEGLTAGTYRLILLDDRGSVIGQEAMVILDR